MNSKYKWRQCVAMETSLQERRAEASDRGIHASLHFSGFYLKTVTEASGGFEEARLVALPVSILDAGALVVRLLAPGNAYFQLGPTATPVGR